MSSCSWSGSSGWAIEGDALRVLRPARSLTRVRAEQLIELVEQGAQRVSGGDDLTVRLWDPRLPPAVSSPDNDPRMVLAEPAQTEHLVMFVRYQPQPARCSFLHFVPPGARRILPTTRLGTTGIDDLQRREGKGPGRRCGPGTRTKVRVRSRPRGARGAAAPASTGDAHGEAVR